jgi:hypothetical protein
MARYVAVLLATSSGASGSGYCAEVVGVVDVTPVTLP